MKIQLNAEQSARFLAPIIEEIKRKGVDHFKKQRPDVRKSEKEK